MYPTRYIEPEAVGYLVAEYVRCGKPGCRCQRGEKHGPYWYVHFRRLENGTWRQRKRYVPRDQVDVVRAHLERGKARDRTVMHLLHRSQQLRGAALAWQRGKITEPELNGVCDEISRSTSPPA